MDCWRWNKTETPINFSVKCYIIISIFTRISSIACKPKSAKWLQHHNRTFKQPRRRQQQRTLETIIGSRSKTTLSFSCGSNFLEHFVEVHSPALLRRTTFRYVSYVAEHKDVHLPFSTVMLTTVLKHFISSNLEAFHWQIDGGK